MQGVLSSLCETSVCIKPNLGVRGMCSRDKKSRLAAPDMGKHQPGLDWMDPWFESRFPTRILDRLLITLSGFLWLVFQHLKKRPSRVNPSFAEIAYLPNKAVRNTFNYILGKEILRNNESPY